MKSEGELRGYRGHVVRFVRVSRGTLNFERKVSFFDYFYEENDSKRERVLISTGRNGWDE